MTRIFVTGTDTDVGKTHLTAALARFAYASNKRVLALKPFETGVIDGFARDADMLAVACGLPEVATADGFYRAEAPFAPGALSGGGWPLVPTVAQVFEIIVDLETQHRPDITLVEGCGGLLVPLAPGELVADLATALGARALVVAHDQLGTISSTLTVLESAKHRGIDVGAVAVCATTSGARGPELPDTRQVLRNEELIAANASIACPIVHVAHGDVTWATAAALFGAFGVKLSEPTLRA